MTCTQAAAGDEDMLVCTVGELHVWPGASNVIPGAVQLSVDIRAKVLLHAHTQIHPHTHAHIHTRTHLHAAHL